MAIANNNLDNLKNTCLSIQISLNGFSFCILQKETNTIIFLKHIKTEKRETPFRILDMLIDAFDNEKALQSSFNEVLVIHENELATLVPKTLFNEDNLADYLKFNSKILKSDFISYDEITTNNSINVYVPYVNINNFIYEKFGAFSYKHFSTILIESILSSEKKSKDSCMYIHVCPTHFEIVIINQGDLQFYNTFEYTTKEDFIYYILFTAEQLKLNPEEIQLKFLGAIIKDDPLYTIAYKYIRHVNFAKRLDNYNYVKQPNTNDSHFTLIQSI